VVIYAPEQGTVEHTGVSGRSSAWLKGVGNADTHRYFIFSRKAECLLYDRKLKTETRLFSVFPSPIITLDLPPDGRYVYFSATIHDADLWLAHLDR
jgi:hypothetical protein